MNDQVKKIIKNTFCSKQKWVQDKDAINCFKCDKKFNLITRRKHHCRICGNVFCNLCTDYFLKGQDLAQNEKILRMCQSCYKKCWKYIKDHDPQYFKLQKSTFQPIQMNAQNIQNKQQIQLKPTRITKRFSYTTEYDKIKSLKSLICDYELQQPLTVSILRAQAQQKISVLIQIMLKQNKISFSYYEFLNKLVNKIVKEVKPNALITKNMNICKHIKFRCSKNVNINQSKYIVGTIVKKSITSKKIKDKYENVIVMLVFGSISTQNMVKKQLTFEQIIQNRKNYLVKLVSKIKQFSVDIIFLQNNIEKQALDLLFQNNITVISKVKVQSLSRIKVSLEIQYIVDGIENLNQYTKDSVVGISKSLYFDQIINFQDNKQPILVIQGQKPQNGITILLSGPDQKILKKIKTQIKPILIIARHFILKMYKVWLDQQLIQSMKPQIRNRSNSQKFPNIFFSWFHQKHQNTASYLKQKFLNYKRIAFVQSQFNPTSFPQISKQTIQEYERSRSNRIFKRKWNFFTEICDIKDYSRRFYSEQDFPMGAYILKKLFNNDKKCQICRKPNYQHIEVYYSSNIYVKIEVQTRIIQQKKTQQQQNININDDGMDSIYEEIAKRKQNHKIECYIQCEQCHQQLTNKFIVRHQHLQLSLLSFLNNIFGATNFSKRNYRNIQSSGHCVHYKYCRVFQIGGSFLRVFVDFLNLFQKFDINNKKRTEWIKLKDTNKNKEICIFEKNKVQKLVNFIEDEIKKIGQLSKNTNYQKIKDNPKASFLKARSSIIKTKASFAGNVMVKSQFCQEILISKVFQTIDRIKKLSQFLLNQKISKDYFQYLNHSYCILYILKKITKIIKQAKISLQKNQLNQKYEPKAEQLQQQGFFLEQFDINAFQQKSQVDKNQLKQSIVTRDLTEKDTDQYTQYHNNTEIDQEQNSYQQWMGTQNIQQQQTLNRKSRKTQSHIITKKQQKNSQQSINQLLKQNLTQLKIQTGFNNHLICNPYSAQTLLAGGLNSLIHKEILSSGKKLQSIKIKFYSSEWEFDSSVQDLVKIVKSIEIQEKYFNTGKEKVQNAANVQLSIYYPNQFQALRKKKNIYIQDYIKTLAGAENWIATGGKSGSPFMRSHNDLVVIKKIRQRQFNTLKKILVKYFDHMEQGSLLTPIYGVYQLIKGNRIQYFIVMQNLFFGMNNWQIYDFKGSRNRRFSKPPIIPLDLNYLLDRNSEPIFTSVDVLGKFKPTLQFLVDYNIIDYSLILVFNIEDNQNKYLDSCKIRIGIIDYLREFGVGQKIEKVIKGPGCTVIESTSYKQRMINSIAKYFSKIPE